MTPAIRIRPRGAKGLGGEQVEGRQAVRELLIAGRRKVHEIWISTELIGHDGTPDDGVADIVALANANRVPVAHVARTKLDARARSEAPQGVIAFAAPLPEAELADLIKRRPGRPPFLVAIDGVTDPGNLGAIIRNCDGAGVHGVLVPRHRAVHVTPTVAKASAGAIEHVPIALVPGLPATLARLRELGIWVVGLDDAADRTLFDIGDLATRGHLPRARRRGRRPVPPRARALRRRREHPDARPDQLAQRVGRGRPGDLRGRPPPWRSEFAGCSAHVLIGPPAPLAVERDPMAVAVGRRNRGYEGVLRPSVRCPRPFVRVVTGFGLERILEGLGGRRHTAADLSSNTVALDFGFELA